MITFCRAGFVVVVALVFGVGAGRGQDAEAVLAKVYATYGALPNLELTVVSRMLHGVEGRPGMPDAGEYRSVGASWQRVVVTWRRPDDWRVVSQREREMRGEVTPERIVVLAKVGAGDGELMVLNATTREPVRAPIGPGLFRQEVLERAGESLGADPVLGAILFKRAEAEARTLGLGNVSVGGADVWRGVPVTRIHGTAGDMKVALWVDEAAGLVLRKVEAPAMDVGGMMRRTRETLYQHEFTRGADTVDFDLAEGWASVKPGIAGEPDFVAAAELHALAVTVGLTAAREGLGRPPSQAGTPGARAAAVAAPTPTPAPAPEARVAGENQLLTSEQMEAIVMIEGDDGVGTGFVTKMRGLDFVVTNLHVIGGNEKIRVTTIRGEQVKVGGMFGAAGRDIAILRVEGEYAGATLRISEDPVKTAKLGDRVAVVGNRRGGGVATQVSGVVRGLGPDRIEVDAPFQPGNSGSPIVHVASGEVIGVASYSQTRELDELDGAGGAGASAAAGAAKAKKEEQRWFGFRPDSVTRWEAIDLVKWRAQAKRIADFESDSEAIYHAMYGRFSKAAGNPRVRVLTDRFEERMARQGTNQAVAMQEVQELFRGLRALADTGVKELKTGDYYDFFRTSEYWETSIRDQLRAREDLARRLEKAADNALTFLSRLRR